MLGEGKRRWDEVEEGRIGGGRKKLEEEIGGGGGGGTSQSPKVQESRVLRTKISQSHIQIRA